MKFFGTVDLESRDNQLDSDGDLSFWFKSRNIISSSPICNSATSLLLARFQYYVRHKSIPE